MQRSFNMSCSQPFIRINCMNKLALRCLLGVLKHSLGGDLVSNLTSTLFQLKLNDCTLLTEKGTHYLNYKIESQKVMSYKKKVISIG